VRLLISILQLIYTKSVTMQPSVPIFLLHEHFYRMMPQYTIEGRASKWSPLNSASEKR